MRLNLPFPLPVPIYSLEVVTQETEHSYSLLTNMDPQTNTVDSSVLIRTVKEITVCWTESCLWERGMSLPEGVSLLLRVHLMFLC